MNADSAAAPLTGGVGLLERAVGYSLGSLLLVTPQAMSRPSPCRDWDVGTLLQHMGDSLAVLHEAVDLGHIRLAPPHNECDPTAGVVATVRDRACSLLGAWANAAGQDYVSVGGCLLTSSVVTATGAIEIAVHGWDVAQACGKHRPIPEALAEELLPLADLVVGPADRPARFGHPVTVSAHAGPAERLLAFLGRDPP
jgi:uncharacterized protein (TIGR03086 family)